MSTPSATPARLATRRRSSAAPRPSLEPTPSGNGYWVVDSRGRVYTYGDATDHGRPDPTRLDTGETMTSLSTTPTGQAYWIFTTRGRVLPFGDAAFHGDMSAINLNAPVVDSRPTPSGQGYFMVAADGGSFTFGDAAFHRSMGGRHLNAAVRSLVPDPDGTGSWLVASDGGVFDFSNRPYPGSLAAQPARPSSDLCRGTPELTPAGPPSSKPEATHPYGVIDGARAAIPSVPKWSGAGAGQRTWTVTA